MIAFQATDLVAYLLVLARISAFLVIAPPFNSRNVPARVKAGLAAGLALAMSSQQVDAVPEISIAGLATAVVVNVAIGVSMGFVVFLLFAALQSAGHLIDLFGGFALTFAYDPTSSSQQSVFGRFYQVMALALFVATPAHAITLAGLDRSFDAVSVSGGLALGPLAETVTTGLSQMFLAALQIAAPLIGVLVIADIALGLLTRVAPALNAFSLGFPLKIMIVLLVVGTTFTLLPESVESLAERSTLMFLDMLGAG